ncbi:MAG TPA: DM13 domain-containing protein [Acidimicrobiia bacterium]|nr:DM13 domain-containing protein [Acidimicrobiia bacterium]
MTKKRLSIAAGVLAIPVLALAWWLGSPLFLDDEVSEEFPMAAGADIPDDMTAAEVEAEMTKAAEEPDTEVEEDMPEESAPVVLSAGEFAGADASHQGSGTATIYELEDGSRVLRFEDFEVTNGPDLHVFLIPEDGSMDQYVDLGSLKGNVGNQNYEIPPEIDVSQFTQVLIYCVPFSVPFASAALA